MVDVSIIIINYKTSRLIADCINSIEKHTSGIDYEIIVIDNNSEPDFENIIRNSIHENRQLEITYLALPQNIGFGRANNEGLKIAKGRNILFLNPDTVLINNAIKILSDFLDTNPKAGACGGNLYDEENKPAYSFKRILPGILWELNELLNTRPEKLLYKNTCNFNNTDANIEVGYIAGADLMVKRQVLEETGGFRKEYFLYYEETDLCFRIKEKGWKIYNVPAARIQHLESKSFNESDAYQNDFKTECLELSRNIYYGLNNNILSRFLSQKIYNLFLTSRILLVKNSAKKEYYRQRKKYFESK